MSFRLQNYEKSDETPKDFGKFRQLPGLVRRRQWEYDRFYSEDTPLLGDVEEYDNG